MNTCPTKARYGHLLLALVAVTPLHVLTAGELGYSYTDEWSVVSAPPPSGPYRAIHIDPRVPGQGVTPPVTSAFENVVTPPPAAEAAAGIPEGDGIDAAESAAEAVAAMPETGSADAAETAAEAVATMPDGGSAGGGETVATDDVASDDTAGQPATGSMMPPQPTPAYTSAPVHVEPSHGIVTGAVPSTGIGVPETAMPPAVAAEDVVPEAPAADAVDSTPGSLADAPAVADTGMETVEAVAADQAPLHGLYGDMKPPAAGDGGMQRGRYAEQPPRRTYPYRGYQRAPRTSGPGPADDARYSMPPVPGRYSRHAPPPPGEYNYPDSSWSQPGYRSRQPYGYYTAPPGRTEPEVPPPGGYSTAPYYGGGGYPRK